MIIIESVTEYEKTLCHHTESDWIIIPVYSNGFKSSHIESLSFLYVYVLYSDEEYGLVFNHTEGQSLPLSILDSFPSNNKLFIYDKKSFRKFLDRPNLIDMDMVRYFHRNEALPDDFETSAHDFFARTFTGFQNLNTIIPLTKHIEMCQKIVDVFFNDVDFYQDTEAFNHYNTTVLNALYEIEKNGLFVHSGLANEYFEKTPVEAGFVFSQYNPYTTTGRPSNRFNGINFAALKKENGERSAFISRFGKDGFLMSFDYDAYHLRLLANLVDYSFPENVSVHEYLGKYYFDKSELTDEEYNESKSISFRQLYGGIQPEYLVVPFFERISEYTSRLWEFYRDSGYIETPMFGRKLHGKFFTDLNPAKLLNYLLQAYETERNMAVISNIVDRIRPCQSKIILYTYDAFLIDFHVADGRKLIEMLKHEFEENGKFPITLEIGPDYNNLIEIKKQI
jgi:hypothetical protein